MHAPPSDVVVTYEAGWETNHVSWAPLDSHRLLVSSFVSDLDNHIDLLGWDGSRLERVGGVDCFYPPSKAAFSPPGAVAQGNVDLFAASGDYLRLWAVRDAEPGVVTGDSGAATHVGSHADQQGHSRGAAATTSRAEVELRHTFKGRAAATGVEEFCAPLTSFDWNRDKPSMLATTSTDTTIAVWDVETRQIHVRLIAHEKAAFDIAFAPGEQYFGSCGAEGSVRIFDLRQLENCTIVYEHPQPIVRIAWNRDGNSNLVAAVIAETNQCILIDLRNMSQPVSYIVEHDKPINALAWAPHCGTLCTVGEDRQAIMWDVTSTGSGSPGAAAAPLAGNAMLSPRATLSYEAPAEINSVSWGQTQKDWVAVTCGTQVKLLRV
jgi:WD repeat-containing protein 68